MKSQNIKRFGFTLIELLVVVLIIGILAAVAVPQYQKAVYKSRYSVMKKLVQSMYEAEQVYYMANGKYTANFEELDISPGGNISGYATVFDWGLCIIELENKYLYCQNNKINLSYLIYFNGIRYCVIYNNSELAKKVCKDETKNDSTTDWYKYQ